MSFISLARSCIRYGSLSFFVSTITLPLCSDDHWDSSSAPIIHLPSNAPVSLLGFNTNFALPSITSAGIVFGPNGIKRRLGGSSAGSMLVAGSYKSKAGNMTGA